MLSLALFWTLLFGSSFEGEIVYLNTYELDNKRLSVDSLRGILGDTVILVMKQGNYKLTTNGSKRITSIYEGEGNVWYVYQNRFDTILAVGGLAQTMDSIVFDGPRNTTESILGYSCRSLVMTWKSGRNTYYFNDRFAIDPSLFVGHNIDGWNLYCQRSKAVPLMTKYEKKGYTRIQKAILIKERIVSDEELKIPQGRPVVRIR